MATKITDVNPETTKIDLVGIISDTHVKSVKDFKFGVATIVDQANESIGK